MRITDLGKIQLQRLRNDIVLNSLYTADYNNRYGIDPHEVQDFFDGYIEYLGELEREKYGHEIDTQDFFAEFDNIENLLEWQYMCMDGIDGCKGISGRVYGELDADLVRDVLLHFENTRTLHEKFTVPIANMLVKKMRKGLDLDLNYLAKSSMIDSVVRETLRDYFKGYRNSTVSTETRNALKHEIAESILTYANDEYEYELENA